MNSGGSGSSKTPTMPKPQGQVAPYGQTSSFAPQFTSFLPDGLGADGRMPMATGLDQSHLAAIASAPPPPQTPPELLTPGGPPGAIPGDRGQFAQMMAQYEKEKFRNQVMRGQHFGGSRDRGYGPGAQRNSGGR